MSLIIDKTYKLLDTLDKSDVVKKLMYYKERLLQDEEVLSLVNKINNEDKIDIKIKLKQVLYNNSDYKNYMDAYNELYYIVMKINNKYREYTNTRDNGCI